MTPPIISLWVSVIVVQYTYSRVSYSFLSGQSSYIPPLLTTCHPLLTRPTKGRQAHTTHYDHHNVLAELEVTYKYIALAIIHLYPLINRYFSTCADDLLSHRVKTISVNREECEVAIQSEHWCMEVVGIGNVIDKIPASALAEIDI